MSPLSRISLPISQRACLKTRQGLYCTGHLQDRRELLVDTRENYQRNAISLEPAIISTWQNGTERMNERFVAAAAWTRFPLPPPPPPSTIYTHTIQSFATVWSLPRIVLIFGRLINSRSNHQLICPRKRSAPFVLLYKFINRITSTWYSSSAAVGPRSPLSS